MSTYTKTTNFTAKDNLTSGDPAKVIKGSEFDTEFNSIETAVNSKADTNNGTHTGTTTISTADIDTLQIDSVEVTATSAELNTLDGITSTTAELNKLDGFTGTVDDLNYAKDLRATGVTSAELDKIDGLTADSTELNILDGATVTTAELNTLDGITSTTAELNVLDGITATTAELNVLDGVTSTTAEINKLDGFTGTVADLNYAKDLRATGVTTAELDVLDGITATTAELNITDGLTATTAELNTLDGITATTTELNYTDGVTSNIQTQLNAMVEKAGDTMTGDLSLGDNVKAKFGASDDLQIYHDGNDSYIDDAGQGSLAIRGSASVSLQNYSGGVMVKGNAGGSVDVYHNNSKKLATTSTGVDVTGTASADGFIITGGALGSGGNNEFNFAGKLAQGRLISDALSQNITSLNSSFNDDNLELTAGATSGYVSGIAIAPRTTGADCGEGVKIYRRSVPALSVNGATGDVSFYEDTGTTAKMVWDASAESLGIGTIPTKVLTTGSVLEIESNLDGSELILGNSKGGTVGGEYLGGLIFKNSDGSGSSPHYSGIKAVASDTFGSANLEFYTGRENYENGTESVMRLLGGTDASDNVAVFNSNVGIGTASPVFSTGGGVEVAHVSSANLRLNSDAGGAAEIRHGTALTIETRTAEPVIIGTNSAERMRIDSSGNLLVGTTDSVPGVGDTNTGVSIRGGNGSFFSRSGTAVYFNRSGSDGIISEYYKDGSTVGGIGSRVGAVSYIVLDPRSEYGGAGLGTTSQAIVPCDYAGANVDGANNLGASGNRFKDLYLSGGVYLGGTGSANKLDDYEEGVWTPDFRFSGGNVGVTGTQYGKFTKIGNKVTAYFEIRLTSKGTSIGQARIYGLPFVAASSPVDWVGSACVNFANLSGLNSLPTAFVSNGTSYLALYQLNSAGSGDAYLSNSNVGDGLILGATVTYFTNS